MTGAIVGTTSTFTNGGSGIGVGITLSGASGDGLKITHSAGRALNIASSGAGYGIIINNDTGSTSAPFTIQKQGSNVITMSDTGAANFTGQLTLGSTITNGTYTYTLPSATGTLALTSALSSYLPLTGGTLTGALNGTSAVFSSSVTANGTLIAGLSNGNIRLKGSTDGFLGVGASNDTLYLTDWTTGAKGLSILLSTGAATFSSTGRFIGALTIGTDFAQLLPISSSNYQLLVGSYYDGTNIIATATSGSRTVYNVGGMDFRTFTGATVGGSVTDISRFTIIASTGAATFSSSVSAGTINSTEGFYSSKAGSDTIAGGAYIQFTNAAFIQANAGLGLDFWTLPTGGGGWTQRMRLTNGGNFLIGTTTDSGYKLDVNGTGRFSGSGANAGVALTVSGANGSDGTIAKFARGGAEKNFYISSTNNQFINLGTEGDFRFKTGVTVDQPYATGVDAMIIKSTGNVGIKTNFPVASLDVSSDNFGTPYAGTSSTYVGMMRIGYTDHSWGGGELNFGVINSAGANYMPWIQAQVPQGGTSTRALGLNPNGGNVLIGTTTDAGYQLDVNGFGRFSKSITSTTVGDYRQATLGSGTGAALFITNSNYAGYGLLIGNSYSYGDCWIQVGRIDATATAYNLLLQTSGGKVLIGTTADNGQLLQVNGTVLATGFFESSSINGKDIIATNPLLALDIDVIKYTRKSDESKDIRYGYSAEQIHSLMPELTDKDVTAVKYLDVHTILISQLQQEIKELKAKMN
jgi:hypothetical protein